MGAVRKKLRKNFRSVNQFTSRAAGIGQFGFKTGQRPHTPKGEPSMMYPRLHCPITGTAPFAAPTSDTFRVIAGWIAAQNTRFRRST
tara:strand:+ start:33 stop:293 length:261 start_codon:yes stop_codon:yes gene_type:complete